ncbi:MAG: TolC family protein [Synergistaceae bacterium]|jgi:outer membrane protein TolC|nr:TolC family protein [Synergistaceae bacterium]
MAGKISPLAGKCGLFAVCCALFLLEGAIGAEAALVLSLDECLAVAEANHPSITGAEASVASAAGRLASNAVSDRTEISGSAAVSRSGSEISQNSSSSLGLSASLKIYDANRSKYALDSSRASLSATEEDARGTLFEVRSNVKSAFLTLLLDYEIARQRMESLKAFEQHLEQAKGFYEAGTKPWYDVTKAEVDLGNAQMSLAEASANIRNARASLAGAMGVDPSEEFEITSPGLDIMDIPDGAESAAEETALENRTDYISSQFKIDAGRLTLRSEARSGSPTISLTGGYNWDGKDFYDLEMGWNTGLRMSVPIVDGGAQKARIDIANAQIMSLEASHEKLRQDILLEVSRAKTDITKARERIRISELTLINAEENRKMAVGRYETGVGDPLEVADALVSFADAQLANKQAHHDLQLAIINLEKATGVEFGLKNAAESDGGKQ